MTVFTLTKDEICTNRREGEVEQASARTLDTTTTNFTSNGRDDMGDEKERKLKACTFDLISRDNQDFGLDDFFCSIAWDIHE